MRSATRGEALGIVEPTIALPVAGGVGRDAQTHGESVSDTKAGGVDEQVQVRVIDERVAAEVTLRPARHVPAVGARVAEDLALDAVFEAFLIEILVVGFPADTVNRTK